MEEDARRVNFFVPQNYEGVCDLFKYIHVNLKYNTEISWEGDLTGRIGQRHLPQARTIQDVVVSEKRERIQGRITNVERVVGAKFSLLEEYFNSSTRMFTGIRFEDTQCNNSGALAPGDLSIKEDVKNVVDKYFQQYRKKSKQVGEEVTPVGQGD